MRATDDMFGLDLSAEVTRLRAQNSKLVSATFLGFATAAVGLAFGLVSAFSAPEPDRIAVDPSGRAVPITVLTKNDPPDSEVTKFAGECISRMLNHSFHNFQNTVEPAIGDCVTGGGSQGVRDALQPLLMRMKKEKMSMASQFVILPFINTRSIEGNSRVYHIQAIIDIGYRGQVGSVRPISYVLQTDVMRVPYDSSIRGVRMKNLNLTIRGS